MTNIDNTLLNAAKITGDHADLYGEHVAFYDKVAALATIKLGRPISGHDAIMVQIALIEARIANRWDGLDNYAEITSLHAIASLYIQPKNMRSMLDTVEKDITDMAAKLVKAPEGTPNANNATNT